MHESGLRNRWKVELSSHNFLDSAFSGTELQKLDFRGGNFPQGLLNVSVANADFSIAKFGRGLLDCEVSNSTFTKTKFSGDIGSTITDCSFNWIKLSGIGFEGVFSNCSFLNSHFKKVYTLGGRGFKFVECQFVDTKIHSCEFNFANFINCNFNNCEIKNTAFSDSTLNSSTFNSCKFIGFIGLNDTEFKNCGVTRATFASAKDLADDDTIWG